MRLLKGEGDLYYQLVPQMRDVEAQPYEWRPYVMRQGAPGYRSASLNTDAHGFRLSRAEAGPVDLEILRNWPRRRGVVVGNSALYGVGVSNDGATVPSWLNRYGEDEWRWANLSLRASVLWQERQVLELYPPERLDALLWVSGVNDLVVAGLGGGDAVLPPFIGQPTFSQRMNGRPSPRLEEDEAVEAVFRRLKLTLTPLARLMETGVRVAFVLQPLYTWVDKPPAPEEAYLIARFDAIPNRLHRAHHPGRMGPLYRPMRTALAAACAELGIPFWDANSGAGLNGEGWLFVDRIHLTDRGHFRLARWLWDRLSSLD